MHAIRVIPCLDVDRGRVVKGVNFVDIRDAGDPVELAARYDREHDDYNSIMVKALADRLAEAFAEWLMMGLRLDEGVSLAAMPSLFPSHTSRLDESALAGYIDTGMLEIVAGRLRATRSGRLLLNRLLADLLIAA